MHLEFDQSSISPELSELLQELDFPQYLNLFNINIPMVYTKILKPLKQKNGIKHFEDLRDLNKTISVDETLFAQIITQLEKLPSLASLLNLIKEKSLQQYHIYQLGNFLTHNQILQSLEKDIFSTTLDMIIEDEICLLIKEILLKYTKNDFAMIKLDKNEQRIRNERDEIESQLNLLLKRYEQEIEKQTGIRMIYPYPKEVEKSYDRLDDLNKSDLISITTKDDHYLINYQLDREIQEQNRKQEQLDIEFTICMNRKLNNLNDQLSPLYERFEKFYQIRVKRTYQYALLWTMKQNNLVLPCFTENHQLKMVDAILPVLCQEDPQQYAPLSIDLQKGSNVLFGQNMSGKTTCLKTIFFQLQLTRMGLPVPAKDLTLHFPEHIEFHLKSSGSITKHLSSFGEEVAFFTRQFPDGAYVLSDELFQSTNPVSGVELSRIFLTYFSDRNSIFFCSSHYLEVLQIPEINLFRMQDIESCKFLEDATQMKELKISELSNSTSYQIEPIPTDQINTILQEGLKSLQIALHFPLNEEIKKKIIKSLRTGNNSNGRD